MTEFLPALINLRYPLVLPDDRVVFHALRPTWEAERLAHMSDRVEAGMAVVDVGAESGDFTALYRSWVGDAGQVVPVEPSTPYWPSIRQTWEANGFTPPAACFVGLASSVTDFTVGDGLVTGWPPLDSLGELSPDFGFRHLAQDTGRSPQITLADLATLADVAVDVLVLDIEGAEYDALAGAAELLADRAVLVYVSVHPGTMADWYHHTVAELHDLMAVVGYGGTYIGCHGGEDFWFYERNGK